jgi:hypothetical protein
MTNKLVEGRFYQNQNFIGCLPKPKVYTKTKFSLPKTFFIETNFTTSLDCVYLGLIFLGLS